MCGNLSRLTLLLCIHIALRPDKSGFKTGAQVLTLAPFYRHIVPPERSAKPINLNRKSMKFQQLGSVDIYVKLSVSVGARVPRPLSNAD